MGKLFDAIFNEGYDSVPRIPIANTTKPGRKLTNTITIAVESNLTTELDRAELHGFNIDDIVWPAGTIQFAFEDPRLPWYVLVDGDATKETSGISAGVLLTGFCIESRIKLLPIDKEVAQAWITSDQGIHDALRKLSLDDAHGAYPKPEMQDTENLHKELIVMCFKILIYCSIPRYRAVPVLRSDALPRGLRRELAVSGPTIRTRHRPIDLPGVRSEPRGSAGPVDPTRPRRRHCLHFRRGHNRTFHSERYVNRRGDTIYIEPWYGYGEIPEYRARSIEPKPTTTT